jgi:hypothetical protein
MRLVKPLTPHPSSTQAGRGVTWRTLLSPLPEFGEGQGVGSESDLFNPLTSSPMETRCVS